MNKSTKQSTVTLIPEQLHQVRRLNTNRDMPIVLMETGDHRQVAMKQLTTSFFSFRIRGIIAQRLRVMLSLRHPHIASVYSGQVRLSGQCTILMAYYPRGSLFDAISTGEQRLWSLPLPPLEAVRLLEEIIAGVAELHRYGIMHGGIKPSNILLKTGQDSVLHAAISDVVMHQGIINDFARRVSVYPIGLADPFLYLAPEQIQKRPTPASDLYALGIIAYLLLTGESPYSQEPRQAFANGNAIQLRAASKANPILPGSFDPVLERALSYAPRHRYRRLQDFAQALRAACDTPDTTRIISIKTDKLPNTGSLSSKLAKNSVLHDEIQPPAPLALTGSNTDTLPPGLPKLPANYHWSPEALKSLPAIETIPVIPEPSTTVTQRDRSTQILWIATWTVIVLIVFLIGFLATSFLFHH
jgi:serine/threonine protein kinase